jgi:hypothetical protein
LGAARVALVNLSLKKFALITALDKILSYCSLSFRNRHPAVARWCVLFQIRPPFRLLLSGTAMVSAVSASPPLFSQLLLSLMTMVLSFVTLLVPLCFLFFGRYHLVLSLISTGFLNLALPL